MIGICTDSNAQLPDELRQRLGIEVVPLTVSINGVDHIEGVDLDADAFWACFDGGAPLVATAAPSPGQFLEAWSRLVARGASSIVSVHIGAQLSGTLNAAAVAAAHASVPVELVDTASASFVVGCATWAAADAALAGADVTTVVADATATAADCGNVFVVGALDLARAGGRLDPTAASSAGRVPVLALVGDKMQTIGECDDVGAAASVMAEHVLSCAGRLRVGVGASDASSFPIADALIDRLSARANVEVVRYRVGASVGAHTGPGTAGAVYHRR